jgi:NAD(P)-dependent dehydrogenase (short-subunit alcohol dehydrogenase family)
MTPVEPWLPNVAAAPGLFRLDGKIAVVTGGAGLYGHAISRALAEAGATVIIASRDREHGEDYARLLRENGATAHAVKFDQSDPATIRALADHIIDHYGPADILVNNAVRRGPTHYTEASAEEWDAILRTNIAGVHGCTAVFSEPMRARKSGAIINIASIYGVVAPDFRIYEGEPFASPPDYAFVKGGLIAYTRYCASLFAPDGVRVNCISPGGYYSGQSDSFCDKYNARIPLGRMAHDADIAGPVIFLASEAARYITGINLMVDGGLTAR